MFLFSDSNCFERYNFLKLFKTFEEIKKYILDNIDEIDNCIHIFEIDCNKSKFKNEIHVRKDKFLQKYAPVGFVYKTNMKNELLEKDKNWESKIEIKTYSMFGADWDDIKYIYKKIKE